MPKPKKNVYVCQECGGKIVTMDIDEGVTPFSLGCRSGKTKGKCKGTMYSSFYNVDQTIPVHYVWYMPKEEDWEKYNEQMQEHFRQGGLDLRSSTQEEMWRGANAGT